MTITVKLYASLTPYLPPDGRARQETRLDVEPGTSVLDVIRQCRIPEALCAIVLVNGVWVGRADRATKALGDGEALAIWPPVAGG